MNTTQLFILISAVIIAIFDVVIIARKGKHESISAHIIRGSKKLPVLAYMFWFLMGHLFWSMPTESVYENTECKTKEVENVIP